MVFCKDLATCNTLSCLDALHSVQSSNMCMSHKSRKRTVIGQRVLIVMSVDKAVDVVKGRIGCEKLLATGSICFSCSSACNACRNAVDRLNISPYSYIYRFPFYPKVIK